MGYIVSNNNEMGKTRKEEESSEREGRKERMGEEKEGRTEKENNKPK